MIERYVYIKLNDDNATDEGRAAVAAKTLEMIPKIPGVVGTTVGTPATAEDLKKWDVSITVRFGSLDDVEPYRVHPTHVEYLDYLEPLAECKKAWNFSVTSR